MTKDMTSGNPTKLILQFAFPMLIGNIFQQFYSMVDSIVVGRGIGVNALAAVGSTSSLNFLIIGFITGLANGFGILVAQRFGARDRRGVKKAVTMSVYMSILIAAIVTAFSLIYSIPLLKLLNTPSDIIKDANIYISIIYAGIFATMFYNLLSAILRAFGNSKAPLYIMIISSIVNIIFNVFFVMGLKLGVAGSAASTDIAQILSCVLCYFALYKHEMLNMKKKDWILDMSVCKKLFILGIPAAIQNSVTAVGTMILQAIVNGFGSLYVAAYTSANKVMGIMEQPSSTFGFAMATYTGQNHGAKKFDRIRLGVRKCIKISTITNIVVSIILILFNRQIVGLFISSSEVKVFDIAGQYFFVTAMLLWDLGLLFIYRSALQGMGNTIIPMISGVIELIMRLITALSLSGLIGFVAIGCAEVSAWAGAESFLMISYYMVVKKKEQNNNIAAANQS